jgi:hypothetical protein
MIEACKSVTHKIIQLQKLLKNNLNKYSQHSEGPNNRENFMKKKRKAETENQTEDKENV